MVYADGCERCGGYAVGLRIVRMDLDERFADLRHQPRRLASAGHGVPLVADAARVEDQRKVRRGGAGRGAIGRRRQLRATVGCKEAAIGEKARFLEASGGWRGPMEWNEVVVFTIVDGSVGADIEITCAAVASSRETRVLGEYPRWPLKRKSLGESHALADFGQLPPVRASLAGAGQEGALARDAALGIGDCAVFFAPSRGGEQNMRIRRCIGIADDIGDDDERAGLQRRADGVGLGHAVNGIGAHDPQRLDAAIANGAKQVHGLQARFVRDAGRLPELLHDCAVCGVVEIHMRGKHIREATNFAPAHGVGLASDRERPHARLADTASGEVAIDDGVDFVSAGGRLVHALAVDRHGTLR